MFDPEGHRFDSREWGPPASNIRAVFYDRNYRTVAPSDVELNGVPLRQEPQGYEFESNNLKTFGAMLHVHVTPDNPDEVPAIDDSIFVPKEFYITSPRSTFDTVSRSAGFRCTYGNPGTDSVEISIVYDSLRTALAVDSSMPYPSTLRVTHTELATGSYFVSDSMLSVFPNRGFIQVWVIASRNRDIEISGRRYRLSAEYHTGGYYYLED